MSKVKNLQNFPRDPEIRDLIVPRNEGEVLVEADLSQAEARVVAWKAREETQKALYREGRKIHEFFGSLVVGEHITKKSHPKEYETAKKCIHGSNYDMAAKRLSEIIFEELDLVVTEGEAKKWQNIYFQTFPRIKTGYHLKLQDELRQGMKVITTPPLGMQRKFYSPWGNDLFREVYAHYAQNVVAFVTNNALNKLYYDSHFKKNIYMQIHDSIILSVPESQTNEAVHTLSRAMTYELEIEGDKLTIPVEVKVGKSYGQMEDYKGE